MDSSGNNSAEAGVDREIGGDGNGEGFMEKVAGFVGGIGDKLHDAVTFGKPTADVSGIHVPVIDTERAELVVYVLIKNPNPIPIPLLDISYLIESDEKKLFSGAIPDARTIHPHGAETIKIPIVLVFKDIMETFDDIKPGSIIPYRVGVALSMHVPVIGRLTLPLEKTGEIPVPYKPDVDVDKIKFRKFSFEETTAEMHMTLENKNDFELGLNSLDYESSLSGESIASAKMDHATKIGKQGKSKIQIPFSFRPKDFGEALWHIIRKKGTGYTLKGNIDVDTPFGNMKLPINKEGGTTRLQNHGDNDDEDDDNNSKE